MDCEHRVTKMSFSSEPASAPDISFLRNVGVGLFLLFLGAGSIMVVGALKAGESTVEPQLVAADAVQ